MSHPRLAQKGPLTGQQFWQAISTVRAIVGLPETLEVPERPVFSRSNVGRLVSENGADGLRLYVVVSGELNEDVILKAAIQKAGQSCVHLILLRHAAANSSARSSPAG
jgi:hypothetical protein